MRSATAIGESDSPGTAGRARRFLFGRAGSSRVLRYGFALGSALAAVLAVRLFRGQLQAYRVLLSFGAVLLASLRGGSGPGFLALALCAAAYRSEIGSSEVAHWLEEPDPVRRLAFFTGFAALGVWGASAVREAYLHTHARRRRAEARACSSSSRTATDSACGKAPGCRGTSSAATSGPGMRRSPSAP